jgi:beta-phosphoglucomutase-like phosphatase (HAD superfamily)
MNTEPAPASALDEILNRTGYLLLDFDGPICSLFAGTNTAPVAGLLRGVLLRRGVALRPAVADTGDWFKIMSFAASAGPDAGADVESELTRLECRAARTAEPTAFAADVLAACAESARPVAVVSNNSHRAVRSYLAGHGLDGLVAAIAARTGNDPARLKPSPYLIDMAAEELSAATADCALVGDSRADILAARLAGVRGIGLAAAPQDRARLAAAGAETVIFSMAELASGLRACCGSPG